MDLQNYFNNSFTNSPEILRKADDTPLWTAFSSTVEDCLPDLDEVLPVFEDELPFLEEEEVLRDFVVPVPVIAPVAFLATEVPRLRANDEAAAPIIVPNMVRATLFPLPELLPEELRRSSFS